MLAPRNSLHTTYAHLYASSKVSSLCHPRHTRRQRECFHSSIHILIQSWARRLGWIHLYKSDKVSAPAVNLFSWQLCSSQGKHYIIPINQIWHAFTGNEIKSLNGFSHAMKNMQWSVSCLHVQPLEWIPALRKQYAVWGSHKLLIFQCQLIFWIYLHPEHFFKASEEPLSDMTLWSIPLYLQEPFEDSCRESISHTLNCLTSTYCAILYLIFCTLSYWTDSALGSYFKLTYCTAASLLSLSFESVWMKRSF